MAGRGVEGISLRVLLFERRMTVGGVLLTQARLSLFLLSNFRFPRGEQEPEPLPAWTHLRDAGQYSVFLCVLALGGSGRLGCDVCNMSRRRRLACGDSTPL